MADETPLPPPINEPAYVRYIFVDIVKFTSERSVEAQCEVINKLNELLRTSLNHIRLFDAQRILIPTGDGVAIALFNVAYDSHLVLALDLLSRIEAHNRLESDKMRQFSVRIGLNENVDNVIEDVNRQRNVAGLGISMAQRIMDKADGGQILVGEGVFQALSPRERYMNSFRRFQTVTKHDTPLTVYQYTDKRSMGLDCEIPRAFARRTSERPKLSKFVAYYLAIAASHREFLLSTDVSNRDDVATILISFLAEDCVEKSETPQHERAEGITWKAGEASFEAQFKYYDDVDFWVIVRLADCVQKSKLESYDDCFEAGSLGAAYAFVSPSGFKRLFAEWPKVAEEFGLVAPNS